MFVSIRAFVFDLVFHWSRVPKSYSKCFLFSFFLHWFRAPKPYLVRPLCGPAPLRRPTTPLLKKKEEVPKPYVNRITSHSRGDLVQRTWINCSSTYKMQARTTQVSGSCIFVGCGVPLIVSGGGSAAPFSGKASAFPMHLRKVQRGSGHKHLLDMFLPNVFFQVREVQRRSEHKHLLDMFPPTFSSKCERFKEEVNTNTCWICFFPMFSSNCERFKKRSEQKHLFDICSPMFSLKAKGSKKK